jgi:hypothetical protein
MSDRTENGVTSGSGKDTLFRDSKFGVLVAGGVTIAVDSVLDGALEALTNVDTSGWAGWWTTLASAALATGVGLVTAYKAKRRAAIR